MVVETTPVHHDSSGVSVDEANILADFFNLQADKHGPEMLKKLSNIGHEGTRADSESLKQP